MIQILLSRIYAIQIKNNNPRFILSQNGRANKAQIASQNLNRKVKKYYYTDCLIKKNNLYFCLVEKLPKSVPFSLHEGLKRCLWTSLESSKSRFLRLPSKNIWQSTRLLIVGLDQGEGVQDLLPLHQVVHVLESCMVGLVEEVEDHHDRVVGKGGGGAGKPSSASLFQQPLQRLKPLGQEFAEVLFHLSIY